MAMALKRVYEPAAESDGYRVLVDRLWPRGLAKEKAKLDWWAKDLAPSPDLRKWFNHEPEKWPEFQRRYEEELNRAEGTVSAFWEQIKNRPRVTLLFGARDQERNQAVALAEYLKKRFPA